MNIKAKVYKALSSFSFLASNKLAKNETVKTNIKISKIAFSELIKASLIFKKNLNPPSSIQITLSKTKKQCGNLAAAFSYLPTGTCRGVSSSPSINWSAYKEQTLFQRACLIGELFGKGRKGSKLGGTIE